MKRIGIVLAILVVAALVLALVPACGESATPTSAAKAATPTTAAAVATATGGTAATPTKAAATTSPTTAADLSMWAGATAQGVTEKDILLGATYPLSGALSQFGVIGQGLQTYFAFINDTKGGVNGRKITLKILDDAYSPPKTLQATRQLVEEEKVFAMVNGFGTAPQSAVVDYLTEKKVPQLFLNSGASQWGADYKKYPYVIGWNPNYQSEASVYAKYILANKPNAKIGILYQNDDYGKDYVIGVEKTLGAKAATMVVKKEPLEVTSADATSQLANLKAAGVDTMIWAVSAKFVSQGLKSNFSIGWKPMNFITVSAFQKTNLVNATIEASEGAISATYVKDPTDKKWDTDAGMIQYRANMKKYYPGGATDANLADLGIFQGYGVAWNLVKVLEQAGKDLTRATLMNAVVNMNYPDCPVLLPGISIKTTPTDWRPIEAFQLVKFTAGEIVLFGDVFTAD